MPASPGPIANNRSGRSRVGLSGAQWFTFLAIAAAYAVVALIFLHGYAKDAKPWRIYLFEDFSYYVRGLDRAVHGGNPYADQNIGTGFLYPPPALLWTALYARLPAHAKTIALLGSQAIYLALCIGMLWKHFGRRALLAAPLWIFAISTVLTFYLGQINLLVLLGIVTLYVYEEERPWLAGLGLATIICAKLSPIVFLVYLALRWRWRVVGWTLAFCVGWSLLTLLFFGISPFLQYRPMIGYLSGLYGYGDSLSRYAAWIFHRPADQKLIQKLAAGLCGLTVAGTALLANKTRDRQPAFIAACISLLLAPGLVWHHQMVWLLLPYTLFWFANGCSPAVLMSTFMIMQLESLYHGMLMTHGVSIYIMIASIYQSLRGHGAARPASA